MDRLPQEPLLSDTTTDMKCSQPQIVHPTNVLQTSFTELCDQQTDQSSTETNVPSISTDEMKIETILEPSAEAASVSPVTIEHLNHHHNQQVTESDETVEQCTNLVGENFQHVITDDSHQNYNSIDLCILSIEQTTVSTIPSGQVKKNKRKQKWTHFHIHIEEEEGSKKLSENDFLKIPEGSAELNYHGETIPVTVEQLYGNPIIDQGGFGTVYTAIIKGTSNIVIAVKRVPRFKNTEITIMETIGSGSCLYIVDYFGAVANPGTSELCICMEYMDASVAAFYRAMHSLDYLAFDLLDQLMRRIAHNIASALHYLEIKEIVHRDIKPPNMLINQNATVKLCDFGISRSFGEMEVESEDIVGTADYIPPGLVRAIQDDMWALGISLREVATGENPFTRWRSCEKSIAIFMWIPSVPLTISNDMQKLMLHLLEKDAQERPHSYSEILNKPALCDVTEMPSNDLCDLVRHVIAKISRPDNS